MFKFFNRLIKQKVETVEEMSKRWRYAAYAATLYGDGIHDDSYALNRFFAGYQVINSNPDVRLKSFFDDDGKLNVFLEGGTFLIKEKICFVNVNATINAQFIDLTEDTFMHAIHFSCITMTGSHIVNKSGIQKTYDAAKEIEGNHGRETD